MVTKMARHQFALSESNMEVLRYLAAKQQFNVATTLRVILRDLHKEHSLEIKAWKQARGEHVEYTDEDMQEIIGS